MRKDCLIAAGFFALILSGCSSHPSNSVTIRVAGDQQKVIEFSSNLFALGMAKSITTKRIKSGLTESVINTGYKTDVVKLAQDAGKMGLSYNIKVTTQ